MSDWIEKGRKRVTGDSVEHYFYTEGPDWLQLLWDVVQAADDELRSEDCGRTLLALVRLKLEVEKEEKNIVDSEAERQRIWGESEFRRTVSENPDLPITGPQYGAFESGGPNDPRVQEAKEKEAKQGIDPDYADSAE